MTHVVLGDMNPIAPKYPITEISSKYLELAEKFNDLTDQIKSVCEWYDIYLSESLYHESQRLNYFDKNVNRADCCLGRFNCY